MAVKTMYRIARLKPERIAEYEKLHDEIPGIIERMLREAGYAQLRIFREGVVLFMVLEHDEALAVPDRLIDDAAEAEWQRVTGACFEQFWQAAAEIYTLNP